MAADPNTPHPDWLTIDELAARTGTTVRTVRFYSGQGLLPAPYRQGRIAYYGPQHRLRLEFVRELQDFGYTLAAIERVLTRIPDDASSSDLALHRALLAPWATDRSDEFDLDGLERLAGRRLDDDALDFLTAVGTLECVRPGVFRTTPSMLASGVEVLSMPVPLNVMREAARVIAEHATAAAVGLSEVFRSGLWEPYRRGDLVQLDEGQMAAVIPRLRPLAVQALVIAFERAADRAIREPLPDRTSE